ncbi:MAG: tyrosine-protein phosphatase [Gammaproteobacteria bacterium]
MIDLHCHMLPFLDDGSKSMEESVKMAEYAVSQGIHSCVMTPHINPGRYDNDKERIWPLFQLFRRKLQQQHIRLRVYMGAEVRLTSEVPEQVRQDKIPFIGHWNDSRVMLLELPYDIIPVGTEKLLNWLIERNITPMIAHPERNKTIAAQPSKVLTFIEMGCLLQVTAGSVSGQFNESSQKCALTLIKNGLVTVIASDAHNLVKRPPSMLKAMEILKNVIGETKANRLVNANPAMILSNYENTADCEPYDYV